MSKEKLFWSWFKENKMKFTDPSNENFENYLDELLEQLHTYNEHLFFEVGGNQNKDENELIITALGERKHFESVYTLVNSAPIIENWRFVALKPPVTREDRFFKSDYYGVELNTRKIRFIPLDNSAKPELIGIRVLVESLDETKYGIYHEGILMIINTIFGEKNAAEDISFVEVCKNVATNDTDESIAITDLPDYIEWKKSKVKTQKR